MVKQIVILLTTFAILIPAYLAEAQQKIPLIGFLTAGTEPVLADRYAAFREKMRALGYIEGRSIR